MSTVENMQIFRFKIAGGNSTSLIVDSPLNDRQKISVKELQQVEQVGFIEKNTELPTLTMMGNELCVNATLAFAKLLESKRGKILTSGLPGPVSYRNSGELTSATFTLAPKIIRSRNIVLFDGIGYVCDDSAGIPTETYLADLAQEFKKPAFGVARYQGASLQPYVYVDQIKSVVAETACGSGSIALNLITGANDITQVTGQRIRIERNGNQFTVTAKVVKMKK